MEAAGMDPNQRQALEAEGVWGRESLFEWQRNDTAMFCDVARC